MMKNIPFVINILIILITYIVLIAAHELGHFFIFKKNNIKMRALFITVFMFIKENGSWKFGFKPNKITAIGGIAIPDVDSVKDEDDFKKIQRSFARALIAGPVTSILFGLISVGIVLTFILIVKNSYLSSMLFTIAFSIVMITLFIIITSFFKNEIVIGDFPAYKMAKIDEFFVAIQYYHYAFFSTNFEKVREENKYLKFVLYKGLAKKLEEKNLHIYTLQIIDTLLVEYLAGVIKEIPEELDNYVDFLLNNDKAFNKVKDSEQVMILWFNIVRLLYINRCDKERAVELFENIKMMVDEENMVVKYKIKQTEHLLGIKDNSEYLKEKKNISISSADGLYKNFEGYYADEMKLNEGLGI